MYEEKKMKKYSTLRKIKTRIRFIITINPNILHFTATFGNRLKTPRMTIFIKIRVIPKLSTNLCFLYFFHSSF